MGLTAADMHVPQTDGACPDRARQMSWRCGGHRCSDQRENRCYRCYRNSRALTSDSQAILSIICSIYVPARSADSARMAGQASFRPPGSILSINVEI